MTREFDDRTTALPTLCLRCSHEHILIEKYYIVAGNRVLDKHTCYQCNFVWYEDLVPAAHGKPTMYEHPDVAALKEKIAALEEKIAILEEINESLQASIINLLDVDQHE